MIVRVRHYDPAVRRRLAEAGRDDYRRIIDPDDQPLVHRRTRTATHRIVLPPAGNGESADPAAVYVKVYRPGPRGFKFLLRPGKAWSESLNLRRLARWGVPAPRVVATGARRTWWGLADEFLMTAEWPGAVSLAGHAQTHWPVRGPGPAPYRDFRTRCDGPISPESHADLLAIARLLADAARAMHRHHFYHVDLQWRNVLVRRGADGRWEIMLLDCPRGGVRRTLPGRAHGRRSDLASLDRLAGVFLTPVERLRWLKWYLGAPRLTAAGRRLARRVVGYRRRFELRRHRQTARVRDRRTSDLTPLE